MSCSVTEIRKLYFETGSCSRRKAPNNTCRFEEEKKRSTWTFLLGRDNTQLLNNQLTFVGFISASINPNTKRPKLLQWLWINLIPKLHLQIRILHQGGGGRRLFYNWWKVNFSSRWQMAMHHPYIDTRVRVESNVSKTPVTEKFRQIWKISQKTAFFAQKKTPFWSNF